MVFGSLQGSERFRHDSAKSAGVEVEEILPPLRPIPKVSYISLILFLIESVVLHKHIYLY